MLSCTVWESLTIYMKENIMRNLNIEEATLVADVIVKHVKHRKTAPFINELVSFLRFNKSNVDSNEYFFLSEDYYPHKLVSNVNGQPLLLMVESENVEILKRTEEANNALAELFHVAKVA